MATYVLIHGAWHGKWCWDKVTSALERLGDEAIAVDLPGHGDDKTPVAEVTLDAYVDRVSQVLAKLRKPVVLVGHSMGGGVITRVAELHPERIRELVYVAGILPKGGQTMAEILAGDPASLIAQNQVLSGDRQSVSIREEALKDIFYGDCSEADVARAKRLLVPQALAPVLAQIHTTERRFGWVPRVYVTTLQDRAIIPDLQARMYTALPCRKVVMLNTSHSPFFSAPTDLAGQLHGLQQDA